MLLPELPPPLPRSWLLQWSGIGCHKAPVSTPSAAEGFFRCGAGAVLLQYDNPSAFFTPVASGSSGPGLVLANQAILCYLACDSQSLVKLELQLPIPVYLQASRGGHGVAPSQVLLP